jgi:hypothetical protein
MSLTMEDAYTPGKVWEILSEGTDAVEELGDVQVGLQRLPDKQRTYLNLLANGWTGSAAMRASGLTGNQTRQKREAIIELTRLING